MLHPWFLALGLAWFLIGGPGAETSPLSDEPSGNCPLALYRPYLLGERPLRVALVQGLSEAVIRGPGSMEGWRGEGESLSPTTPLAIAQQVIVTSRFREVPSGEPAYRLVIGQYRDQTTAEEQAGRIRQRGLKAYVRPEGDTVLVQVDGFQKRDWAETLRQRVASAGYPDCRTEPYFPLRRVPGMAVVADENELPGLDWQGLKVTPAEGTLLKVEARNWSSRSYRGTLWVQPGTDGRLAVVNEVCLEDYLKGVVPLEMGPASAAEALKAQAVAARTYALTCLFRDRRENKEMFPSCAVPASGYHFAVQNTQAYGGVQAENSRTDACVAATRGEVLTFEDQLVQTVFHTVCGGQTEDVSHVWGRPAPCLWGVCDGPSPAGDLASPEGLARFLQTGADSYCRDSPNYRWTVSFSRIQLQNLLGRTLPRVLGRKDIALGPLLDLRVEERSPNGRVEALAIVGRNQTYLVRRDAIRWLFGSGSPGPTGLKSTLFLIQRSADGDRYTFLGGGWGHGAGLCQQGAQGMARAGYTYQEILFHYYPGAVLTKVQ